MSSLISHGMAALGTSLVLHFSRNGAQIAGKSGSIGLKPVLPTVAEPSRTWPGPGGTWSAGLK